MSGPSWRDHLDIAAKTITIGKALFPGGGQLFRTLTERFRGPGSSYHLLTWARVTANVIQLIALAGERVVHFGGDLSWAPQCADAIGSLTGCGKRVVVICPADRLRPPGPRRNAALLIDRGAELIRSPVDLGLRGLLVDPDGPDGLYYDIIRQRKPGLARVESGLPDGAASHYKACLYRSDTFPAMLKVTTGLYRLVAHYQHLPGAVDQRAQGDAVSGTGRPARRRKDNPRRPDSE